MAREFILPLILVFLLILVLILFLAKNGMIYSIHLEGFQAGNGPAGCGMIPVPMPTLEERTQQVAQATQDTFLDRKVNLRDEPVIYTIWSGYMSKRGLPPIYITPDVYGSVRAIYLENPSCPDLVRIRTTLMPSFKKEQEWIRYNKDIRAGWVPNYQGSY